MFRNGGANQISYCTKMQINPRSKADPGLTNIMYVTKFTMNGINDPSTVTVEITRDSNGVLIDVQIVVR